jgi:DNA-binding NtrC family response regulator
MPFPQKEVPMKRKRIVLIVDDEHSVLELFHEILSQEEYTVLTANNGQDGLSLVRRRKPDLVILDLKLCDMSGLKVLREIERIDEKIEVIMITGYGAMNTAKTAMRLGAYEYITKPFDIDYVKTVIKDALSCASDSTHQKVPGDSEI